VSVEEHMPQLAVRGIRLRSWLIDTLGIAWVLLAGVAVFVPALVHGASLGSFDLLNAIPYDQVMQYIPWTAVAWTQVHHGLLPLWNPYSALGMPLAFNWQSATFGVPMLLGYLVPLRFDYTIQIVVTLAIAGTGVYVLGRVLRLGVFGCVFAATVYELSGPFMAWLGWPQAGCFSWMGWIFAAALLVVRGGKRARNIALFAVVLAFTIYAGFPEGLALLALSLGVFLLVLLGFRAPRLGGSGAIVRPVVDLALGTIAGAALGAPLALPALQLSSGSSRAAPSALPGFHVALPVHDILNVMFQGFYGLPTDWFDSYRLYPETAAYVGIIALVMAGTGLVIGRRRPAVIAFGAVVLATGSVVFVPSVMSLMNGLPDVGGVLWTRARTPMAFALAVLSGMGIDRLIRSRNARVLRRCMGAGFMGSAIVMLALWAFARGHLPPSEAVVRADSFIWPAIGTAVGLFVVAALTIVARSGHQAEATGISRRVKSAYWAALSLLVCETVSMVAAGVILWSSAPSILLNSPSEEALKQAVGSALVGFSNPVTSFTFFNINDVFGVQEFDVYDPMTPESYFRTWHSQTGEVAGTPSQFKFVAAVQTTAIARLYGVEYVLVPAGLHGPQGAIFDTRLGGYGLYRVPDAASATLTPIAANQEWPELKALGRPVLVTHADPDSWSLTISSSATQVLRLRLTDVPGWRATIDGRPMPLYRFSGFMLQARIPPGRHHVELNYSPAAFIEGTILAVCSGAAIALALCISRARSRPS